MAWDFSTDPEFREQRKLRDGFVTAALGPINLLRGGKPDRSRERESGARHDNSDRPGARVHEVGNR